MNLEIEPPSGVPGDTPGAVGTEGDLEQLFEGIIFGVLDAVVLGPMRSEMTNMMEEDQSSSTYF